jgi:hypothetical protein
MQSNTSVSTILEFGLILIHEADAQEREHEEDANTEDDSDEMDDSDEGSINIRNLVPGKTKRKNETQDSSPPPSSRKLR